MEALRGIKIAEFAAFAAGPVVGKHLVDYGATVVHVESKTRPDGFRTHYPPYKDNVH
ncbi:MAG: CoA transferase, partial [Candidatus Binatia bacterium]